MIKPVIILGGGGHARVLAEAIRHMGGTVLGHCVPSSQTSSFDGSSFLSDEDVLRMNAEDIRLANGIGVKPKLTDPGTMMRRKAFDLFAAHGFVFPPVFGLASAVASDASVDAGAQIMSGAVVQPGAQIFRNAVVNSGAIIEHDCKVGAHSFISPGVTCCGSVEIGEGAFVGAGATILPGVVVGKGSIIGAGVVVRRSVTENEPFLG